MAKGKRREFGDVLLALRLVVRVNDAINETVNVNHVGLEEHRLLKNRVTYLGNLASAQVQHFDLLVPLSACYAGNVANASVDELRVPWVLFGVDEEYLRIGYLTLQTEVFTLEHRSHHQREQEGLAVLLRCFHHMNVAHRGHTDAVLRERVAHWLPFSRWVEFVRGQVFNVTDLFEFFGGRCIG